MSEETAILGSELLNIKSEDLIQSPTNENNMLLIPSKPDIEERISVGDLSGNKIKVLSVPSDKTGVGKYRSIDPHKMLHKLFKDDFFVEINPEPNYDDLKYLKNFDIVHIHKTPTQNFEDGVKIIKKIQEQGCKVIVDTDDLWVIDSFNPNYVSMIKTNIHKKLIDNLIAADWVTTTTPIYANEIKKYNKNVVVLANAIDPEEPQFQPQNNPSDKIRIGFLGGSSHLADIQLIRGLCNRLIAFQNQIQLVLIGYDLRGSIIEMDENGKRVTRAMKPEETVWYEYEQIFTSNWLLLQNYPEYVKFLKQYREAPFDEKIEAEAPYRRLWTKDIHNYAKNYNNLDISLAPLVENRFNAMKSQLKAVEAGFHKKALVAQDYGPYQLELVNLFNPDGSINNKGNAVLIDSKKNHKLWFKYIKKLIDNPELITLLGENLYELANDKFNLRKVTQERAEFYRSIL